MLLGMGIDLVEVERMDRFLKKKGAERKCFTDKEISYCRQHRLFAPHFAGHFAAKEAVVKALGTGFSQGIHFLDIEVDHDASGKPYIILSNDLKQRFPHTLLLSITHSKYTAAAVVLYQKI